MCALLPGGDQFFMQHRFFGFMLIAFLSAAQVYGQRVIAQLKADPIATNRSLSFNPNYAADGRMAPNIVFASVNGNLRGFISAPSVLDTSVSPARILLTPGHLVVFN